MPFRFLKCLAVVAFIHVCAAMLVYGAYQLTRSDGGEQGLSGTSPSDKQNYHIMDPDESLNQAPEQELNVATQPRSHTVQSGESYYSISRMYNISMNDLKDANNGKALHPGGELTIPQR